MDKYIDLRQDTWAAADDLKRELADYYIQDFEDIKNNTYEVL